MALQTRDVAIALELNAAHGVAGSARQSLALDPTRDIAVEPLGDGFLIYAGPAAFTNRALGLGMRTPVTDAQLDRLASFYLERQVTPSVELCPYADASLLDGLRDRGYVLKRFQEVLYREFDPAEDLTPLGEVQTLPLDRSDAGAMERVARLIARGFREGEEPGPDRLRSTIRLVSQSTAVTFAAVLDGEWVGAGVMARSDGPAALFAASTLPGFRRRGVQAALIRARLACAQSQGATLASILCAPGIATRRNAERQGFTCAYTKAEMVLPQRSS